MELLVSHREKSVFFSDVVKLIDRLEPHKDFLHGTVEPVAPSISSFTCPVTSILATPFGGATWRALALCT